MTHPVDLFAGRTGDDTEDKDNKFAGHHRYQLRPESDSGLSIVRKSIIFCKDQGLTRTAYRAISGWLINIG